MPHESPFAIRATMPQEIHHAMAGGLVDRLPSQIHESTDSAHAQILTAVSLQPNRPRRDTQARIIVTRYAPAEIANEASV